jgi:TatD DNase family protein
MFLVDSHCHLDQLDLTNHSGDLSKALAHAAERGVGHMLCVCITLEKFPDVLHVAEQYKHISASVGLHPNEQNVPLEPTADDLIKLAQHPKIVAIGETGLDYYRSTGDISWQQDRFRQHIRASKETGKPLIVHSRQAKEDTLAILKEENAQTVGGVLHCFTEDWPMAQAAMDLNFYISFSGIVTFKNATEIQDVAQNMPIDRMLIETDSPYLAPIPFRGKPNEPAYVRYVAEYIAQLRGMDVVELAEKTSDNFFRLFKQASR